MIAAGAMDRRVAIESFVEGAADVAGQASGSWVEQAEVWARVRPLSGREGPAGAQRVAEADTEITIRHRTDVSPREGLRISYDGRIYDLLAVQELGRREGLVIQAQTRAE